MKDAQCKRCLKRFERKDIYTIQQFEYRKIPTYHWSLEFFKRLGIGVWDSFCADCMMFYLAESDKAWKKKKTL